MAHVSDKRIDECCELNIRITTYLAASMEK